MIILTTVQEKALLRLLTQGFVETDKPILEKLAMQLIKNDKIFDTISKQQLANK